MAYDPDKHDPIRHSIYMARYRAKNKEKIRQAARIYYAKNRSILLEKGQEYYRANLEKQRDRSRRKNRAAYAKDPEKIRAQKRARYAQRRDHYREQGRIRRQRNPSYFFAYRRLHADSIHAYQVIYRFMNKAALQERDQARYPQRREQLRISAKAYYQKNRARTLQLQKIWVSTHREKAHAAEHRHHARKKGAAISDLTHAQWLEIQEAQDHRCAYCHKKAKGKLTQDHITPLSKGGNHTFSNIIGACQPCNSSKHTGPPLVPVQPLLFTLAPAKKTTKD